MFKVFLTAMLLTILPSGCRNFDHEMKNQVTRCNLNITLERPTANDSTEVSVKVGSEQECIIGVGSRDLLKLEIDQVVYGTAEALPPLHVIGGEDVDNYFAIVTLSLKETVYLTDHLMTSQSMKYGRGALRSKCYLYLQSQGEVRPLIVSKECRLILGIKCFFKSEKTEEIFYEMTTGKLDVTIVNGKINKYEIVP